LADFHVFGKKNDQNDPKNGIKNDVKMATVNTPESKNNKNEAKMHFTWSSAVLASFKLPLKRLSEIIFMNWSLKLVVSPHSLQTCYYV
jgi:hypothetical protein